MYTVDEKAIKAGKSLDFTKDMIKKYWNQIEEALQPYAKLHPSHEHFAEHIQIMETSDQQYFWYYMDTLIMKTSINSKGFNIKTYREK
jgi:hypothetical protein